MADQFVPYVRAWRAWGNPDAALAISGRFSNYGDLRALQIAARKVNWEMSLEPSRVLRSRNIVRENERFPAVVFKPSEPTGKLISEGEAARFFGS